MKTTSADPVAEACRLENAKLHAGDPENVGCGAVHAGLPEEIDRIYRRLMHFDHTTARAFTTISCQRS